MYERVPHITLRSIANNAEIDVIWERWQETLELLRAELNGVLGRTWEEWEIPREAGDPWPETAAAAWRSLRSASSDAQKADALLALNGALGRTSTLKEVPISRATRGTPADRPAPPLWEARIARQQEIDASIAAKADYEYLYDKPYADRESSASPARHRGELSAAPHARRGRERRTD